MNNRTVKQLIASLPLNVNDLVRIGLEMIERLEGRADGLTRLELLNHLRRIIQEGVRAIELSENTVPFMEAAQLSLEARQDRRPTTRRDLRHYIGRMLRDEEAARRPLRAWSVKDCKALLQKAFGNSPSSFRKGRAILNSIFMYGIRHEWCDKNPVAGVESPMVEETPIMPLSNEEISRLEQAAESPKHRDMALSLRLMLYCGVRPTEVTRIDAQRDIVGNELIIRPSASKTGGGRVIPLRKVATFLKSNPQRRIIPHNWQNRWRALRRAARFFSWKADACRHTFATYHVRYFKDFSALQLEMGHRDSHLLRTRYVIGIPVKNASEYWR